MRFSTAILLIAGFSANTFAQYDSTILSTSVFKVGVDARGSLFHLGNQVLSEYPAMSDKHMINYAGLWMMGESGGNVYGVINTQESQQELWPGPVDTLTGLPVSGSDWNRIWKVTEAQVVRHRANYQSSGYQIDQSILDWPAKHSTPNVSPILAPFIDWNTNGTYDPQGGDYPNVPGTSNAYFIVNDGGGEHVNSGSPAMGVEVQGTAYTLNTTESKNAVFVQYNIVNRSMRDYNPFYVAFYLDLKLGNPTDNRIGTDVDQEFVYAFNGDLNDDGEGGYGKKLPNVVALFPLASLDGTVCFHPTDSVRRIPTTSAGLKNIMTGKWADGADRTFGDKGYQGTEKDPYIYTGTEDVNNPNRWTDSSSGDASGKRDALLIHRFDKLNAGEFVQLNVIVGVRTDVNTGLTFQRNQAWEMRNAFEKLSIPPFMSHVADIQAYPNPVALGDVLHVSSQYQSIKEIKLINHLGVTVHAWFGNETNKKNVEFSCSADLPPGVYHLNVVTESSISTQKVFIHQR